VKRKIAGVVLVLLLAVAAISPIAVSRTTRVILLMHSMGVIAAEFFPMMERFEELGIAVDVAAGVTGPYTFWEDSFECFNCTPIGSLDVALTIDDVDLQLYDALLLAPGFAHSFWLEPGRRRGIELLNEAAEQGMLLGGISWSVWTLLGQGLLDGRTACEWPHPLGILKPSLHWSGFLSNFDVDFVENCVWTDLGQADQPTIITANHSCPELFADAIAKALGVE